MFLQALCGGDLPFQGDDEEEEKVPCDATNNWLLSVAQGMRFCVSKGKLLTPKYVGLALSLHQATRSKKLISLFHKAGHVVSYKHVLNLNTAMAQSVLDDLDPATGGIVPQNIVPDRFVHFSADNIDILDDDSLAEGSPSIFGFIR